MLILAIGVALPTAMAIFQDWPAILGPHNDYSGRGELPLLLLAGAWVFALPFPYWGYRRSIWRGHLAIVVTYALGLILGLAVHHYVRGGRQADTAELFVVLATLLSRLSYKVFRALIGGQRVESIGSLMVRIGFLFAILHLNVSCSVYPQLIALLTSLLMVAGCVHMAWRLAWLRRAVDGHIPGLGTKPIPPGLLVEWQRLPSLHDPPPLHLEEAGGRLLLLSQGDGTYRSPGEQAMATFFPPGALTWLRIGFFTMVDSAVVCVFGLVVAVGLCALFG
jgi:hypothetical protein